jgi:hypothetical protein
MEIKNINLKKLMENKFNKSFNIIK